MSAAHHRHRHVFAMAAAALLLASGLLLAPGSGDGSAIAATAKKAGKGLKLALISKTFWMSGRDEKTRLVVRCPGRNIPLGGGMKTDPPPGPDGEGVYPHSYERLGVQSGWHVTPVLFSPSGQPQPRKVTMQVKCRRQVPSFKRRRTITYVSPGETETVVAKCPGPRRLIGGGYQRTDFVSRGGNYATESRAISAKEWRVTGSAFGRFGGQLVSIVYCLRTKKRLVKTVAASTVVLPGTLGAVTTPRCPKKRKMIFGGFSTSPDAAMFSGDGYFNPNHSWTATAFNYWGPTATLTAFGYCVKLGRLHPRR